MLQFITENIFPIATILGFIMFIFWGVRKRKVTIVGKPCIREYWKIRDEIIYSLSDEDLARADKSIHKFFEKYVNQETPGTVKSMTEELHALVWHKHAKIHDKTR
jgi:hypothetical protein